MNEKHTINKTHDVDIEIDDDKGDYYKYKGGYKSNNKKWFTIALLFIISWMLMPLMRYVVVILFGRDSTLLEDIFHFIIGMAIALRIIMCISN
jgi:hypothetical protein